jgi:hypothetical protein
MGNAWFEFKNSEFSKIRSFIFVPKSNLLFIPALEKSRFQ